MTERVAVLFSILQRGTHLLQVCCLAGAVKFTHEWRCRRPVRVVSGDVVSALRTKGVLAPGQWVVEQVQLVPLGQAAFCFGNKTGMRRNPVAA